MFSRINTKRADASQKPRRNKGCKVVLVATLLLTAFAVTACRQIDAIPSPTRRTAPISKAHQWLRTLSGSWQGSAEQTPLGKMPYNIVFQAMDQKMTQGKSKTNGQAIHTWSFHINTDGALALDFHTTFGNSRAKGLHVTREDATKGLLFSGGTPGFLKVWVRLSKTASQHLWRAEILLHEKPHVRIIAQRKRQ